MLRKSCRKRHRNTEIQRSEVVEICLRISEGRSGRKGRVIDLGAGHCKFSLLAHQFGWEATALDARTTRRPDLPHDIRYICASVDSDAWDPADYDFVLCLGLYYHLDQEMQYRLLKRCRGKDLLLDTHYSHPDGRSPRFAKSLSPIEKVGRERGSWYLEAPELTDERRKAVADRASFENRKSWWPTRESLISTLRAHGWRDVWIVDGANSDNMQRAGFYCPAPTSGA